jgi:hypothetical protein
MTSTGPSPRPGTPPARQSRGRRRARPPFPWVAPHQLETGSAPGQSERRTAWWVLWLLLLFGVVALATFLGTGTPVPTLLGDPEGWSIVLLAPAAGLAAGIAAGLIARSRHLLALGFLAALAGLGVGVLLGSRSWPGAGGGGDYWLVFLLIFTGVPFVLAYGVIAVVSAAMSLGRQDEAETGGFLNRVAWAVWDFLTGFSPW